ncbi:hypothetical protein THAOC_29821 [Thalassiosira oceanica]|uniref:Uncharacterized protein n=1 Tax=Thalassiosira oceanica TaxID=159749 RepID=K0RQA0_THAOC|nr:hypothetical protein THAOC_29821 [Thalassiosira oceanica]|mmetsp:Transcript_33136/g.79146  ORF Transcript_33136/g.79146 Transcript_33136/m.79146 type:complete len:118 (+) Transcript_33136:242-595(+)|eukprot:EJK51046.1 hypothetical protein THAOC_29821 [Thalassiosira oceanica]
MAASHHIFAAAVRSSCGGKPSQLRRFHAAAARGTRELEGMTIRVQKLDVVHEVAYARTSTPTYPTKPSKHMAPTKLRIETACRLGSRRVRSPSLRRKRKMALPTPEDYATMLPLPSG